MTLLEEHHDARSFHSTTCIGWEHIGELNVRPWKWHPFLISDQCSALPPNYCSSNSMECHLFRHHLPESEVCLAVSCFGSSFYFDFVRLEHWFQLQQRNTPHVLLDRDTQYSSFCCYDMMWDVRCEMWDVKSERFFQSARKRILRAQLQNCDHFFHNDILNFHDPSSQVDEFSEPVSSLKSTVVRYCTIHPHYFTQYNKTSNKQTSQISAL